MLQLYKQNKKLFLTLIEKSFTEKPSPLEIRKEDKYLKKETLEKLNRKEIDEMVETDINDFISSLDGDDEDTLVDKNIDIKRKEQLQILINYINASTAIQEKFATDYTKIDIQKLGSAFNIVREARKKTQEVKKDVSNKNKPISEALLDAKNEKNFPLKILKENALLAKLGYLTLKNDNLNVSKSEREIAIKSLQKKLGIKETGIFDTEIYSILEKTYNLSGFGKTSEINSNQAPANQIKNGEKKEEIKNAEKTILEFNPQKDAKNKEKVKALQNALNVYFNLTQVKNGNEKRTKKHKLDTGIFGPITEQYYFEAKKKIKENIGDIKEGEKSQEDVIKNAEKVIASFNIKNDSKDKEKVGELQKTLNTYLSLKGKDELKINKIFDARTNSAFSKAENQIKKSLNIGTNELPQKGKNTLEGTKTQIDKTKASVLDLKQKLEITAELNKNLEKYFFDKKEGYSIVHLIEKIAGKEALDKMIPETDKNKKLLNDPENKKKLESAMIFLSSSYKESIDSPEGTSSNDKLSHKGEGVLSTVGKILPWLGGIYLFDIPISLTTTLLPGADINKSVAFEKWIGAGMPGEFKDYYKENKKEVGVLENQNTLTQMLSELNLPKVDKEKVLEGKLLELNKDTLDLIRTYIAVRLIPDLKILQRKSYGIFEKAPFYTFFGLFGLFRDKKYSQGKDLIEKLEMLIKEGNNDGKKNLAIADKVLTLLIEENSKKVERVIEGVKSRQTYFEEVGSKNEKINHITWLITWLNGEGKEYKNLNLNILFDIKNLAEIVKFGLEETDQKFLLEIYNLIIAHNEAGLKSKLGENGAKEKVQNIIQQLFEGGSKKYLLSQIKNKDGLEYAKVGKAQHGPSIKGLNGGEVYQKLSTTTTEENGKIPSLANVYKTFVENGFHSLSYDEFGKAVRGGKQVPLGEVKQKIQDNPLLNTSKKGGKAELETLSALAERKGDTEVFALDPIIKSYTYYKDGKEITSIVTYNLYLRPDCSNPLIVPTEIKKEERITDIPFDSSTYILVNGKLPIVIPWFLLATGKTQAPSNTSSITTTPGHEGYTVVVDPSSLGGTTTGLGTQGPVVSIGGF